MSIEVQETSLRIQRCLCGRGYYVERYSRIRDEWVVASFHSSSAEALAAASGYVL